MTTPARVRLATMSASALFFGAGLVTIANSFATEQLGERGVHVHTLQIFGVLSILSGFAVRALLRRRRDTTALLAVATWGLALLVASAAWGGSVTTAQAPSAIPVFLMVILVWLGLTAPRGTPSLFAPAAIGTAAFLAVLPRSRLDLSGAAMVIVVSTVVAETIAWAMTELRRREDLLAAQARTDALTGLLNRAAFTEALETSATRHERVMLAFADLNGFKDVNDTFGHQVGDELLAEVGRRLRRVVHASDIVARFGGDEFVILFRMVPPGIRPDAFVERIRGVLDQPWPAIAPARISASVGIVDGTDGVATPEALLRAADTAMYSRKHGTEGAGTPVELTSRALAYHRAAMDGLGGGFTVLRRETAPDGTVDWLVIAANARVRSVYLPAVGDPVGKRHSDLNRVADNSGFVPAYDLALTTGLRQEQELELSFPDGTTAWRRHVVVPVDHETVAALTWNITAERAARRELADSEERSTAIIESAEDAIVLVEADGSIRSFNRAAEAMFRTPREAAAGTSYATFVPDESRAVLRDAFAGGPSRRRVDVTLRRADGEEFAANVAVSIATTSSGQIFATLVRDVTEQRAAEAALRHAVECDDLTGRPNLYAILERTRAATERADRSDRSIGLLFVDLDRFTLVNDSLGHDHGDTLLVAVADRLAAAVREEDVVARVSADHFVILCEQVSEDAVLVGLAGRIHEALRCAVVLGSGHEVFVSASIGAARWTGSEQPRDLLRFAHTAMQRARQHGPAGIEVFNGEMAVVAAQRLETETALRRALDRDELRAHYQPIIDIASGAVESVEALVRWEQPGVGLVHPADFIGVAEETGLVTRIGAWMLRRALGDCASWQATAPGVGVSVNVSVHQLRDGELVATLRSLIAELGLAADLVTLEITESVMLEHSDWNVAVLEQIRALGVRLALDDFGTGYSALTHLRRLPIDTIKIDRSFLTGVDTDRQLATIRAIVELARAHGIRVAAEGIESEATRQLVHTAGCDRGQGFLFGRPQDLAATRSRLAADGSRAVPS